MWVEYDFTALPLPRVQDPQQGAERPQHVQRPQRSHDRTDPAWRRGYTTCTRPKEQLSRSTSQFEWVLIYLGKEGLRHAATFEKYPMKDIGLRKQ